MIVKYLWTTDRYDKHWRQHRERTWRGWFLFGLIPIYVETVELIIK